MNKNEQGLQLFERIVKAYDSPIIQGVERSVWVINNNFRLIGGEILRSDLNKIQKIALTKVLERVAMEKTGYKLDIISDGWQDEEAVR